MPRVRHFVVGNEPRLGFAFGMVVVFYGALLVEPMFKIYLL
jgi:hypothetical protein